MAVGPRLVLTGKIQVDIRHLAAAKPQKGLKGDVKSVFFILLAAHRTNFVRHIRAAAIGAVLNKLTVPAFWAAVMGRQGVDLRNTGHIGHQRRANRTTGTHQVAVFQRALHQFLGGHVHHIVLAQNAAQFNIQPVHDQRRRVLSVQPVDLLPHQTVQILLRVLQPGRKQLLRQQLKGLHLVRNQARIGNDHLIGLLLPQIRKLLQHLGGGLKVNRKRFVGIRKFFRGKKDMAIHLVLRVQKVDVSGGTDGFTQLLTQADDGSVKLLQVLLAAGVAISQHKAVVAQGLNLQIVVKIRNTLQLIPVLAVHHRFKKLPRLTGGAHNDPLPVLFQHTFGDDRNTFKVFEVGI